MTTTSGQAAPLTREDAKQSIDDLVRDARRYRSSDDYVELLEFAGRFRQHAPFNSLLIHAQRPGAAYVAPAHVWADVFDRRVTPGQQPIVILRPFAPVVFVYDVGQTEPLEHTSMLPFGAEPFAMPPIAGVEAALDNSIRHAKPDGVRVHWAAAGSHAAGCIRATSVGGSQEVEVTRRPPSRERVPVLYDVEVNGDFSPTERYATLAHELAHLYCGHIGTPNPDWWPDRRHLDERVREFEAESAAYIACLRLDDSARMPPHLAQYLHDDEPVPEAMSLDRVMVAAGRLVDMCADRIEPRREKKR